MTSTLLLSCGTARAEHLEWEAQRAAEKAALRQAQKQRDEEEQKQWQTQDSLAWEQSVKARREALETEVRSPHHFTSFCAIVVGCNSLPLAVTQCDSCSSLQFTTIDCVWLYWRFD